jgi:hypothetical protein
VTPPERRQQSAEFFDALDADVEIDVGPAETLPEKLALRDWFDRRQQELRRILRGGSE